MQITPWRKVIQSTTALWECDDRQEKFHLIENISSQQSHIINIVYKHNQIVVYNIFSEMGSRQYKNKEFSQHKIFQFI